MVYIRYYHHVNAAVVTAITFMIAVLLMWPTVLSIIDIWSRNNTFTHGYFVFPVFLFMVWHKRDLLISIPPEFEYRVIPLILVFSLLWLISKLSGIQVVEQVACVLILICCIWSVLGNKVAKIICFPLSFLLFLAPVGEELVPLLMEITADATVWAIALTGIPIFREGLYFSLPSGNWSVVEACSGIRYLIASIVLCSVYAYLNFETYRRRLLLMVLSVLVPIIANSARAYLIVMLGHFSGNRIATGVDHLVYGWLFFGFVMFILFWLSSFFNEK